MSDWLKILAYQVTEEIPEGWSSTAQIAEQLNITHEAAYKRLRRKLNDRIIEQKKLIYEGVRISIWRPIDQKKDPARGS